MLTLGTAVDLFVEAHVGVLRPRTVEWYQQRLGRLVLALGPETPLTAVGLADLRAWRAQLVRQPRRWEDHPSTPPQDGQLAARTIHGYVQGARRFFRWVTQEGYLVEDPAARLEGPRLPEEPPKWLKPGEAKRLLDAAKASGPRDYALLRVLLFTGMRRGEAIRMEIEHLSLDERCVWVTGKGGKRRPVFFDRETARALRTYLGERHSGRVWLGRASKPLKGSGITSMLRRLCEAAGLPRIGPHRLRHTFAYQQLKRGTDPDVLRRQMGHADLGVLYNSYVRWINDDLREAFAEAWL